MRNIDDGEKKKRKKKEKIMVEIVATTSLPVDRLTATDCNAAARAKSMPNTLLTLYSLYHKHRRILFLPRRYFVTFWKTEFFAKINYSKIL